MTLIFNKFEFHMISQFWDATTAKRINPYCQRQNCSPL